MKTQSPLRYTLAAKTSLGRGRMAHILWPHLLSLSKWFHQLSRNEAPDGRLHPYGSDNVGPMSPQSVSTPLQDSIRFFHHLSPYLQQHALRLACPLGRRHEVTTFRVPDSGYLRPTLSAGGSIARVGRLKKHPNHPLTFWFKPHSSFGLSRITTVASVHLHWP